MTASTSCQRRSSAASLPLHSTRTSNWWRSWERGNSSGASRSSGDRTGRPSGTAILRRLCLPGPSGRLQKKREREVSQLSKSVTLEHQRSKFNLFPSSPQNMWTKSWQPGATHVSESRFWILRWKFVCSCWRQRGWIQQPVNWTFVSRGNSQSWRARKVSG